MLKYTGGDNCWFTIHDFKKAQLLCMTHLVCDGLKRKSQKAQSPHCHFGGYLHQSPIQSVMRGMRKSKWHPRLGNHVFSLNHHAAM